MSQTMSDEGPRPDVEAPTSGLTETPEEIEYEMRSAEGAMWTGARLVIAIAAFFFASLAFAYFYLRSADNADLWRPHGITAPTATGAAILAFMVAAAGLAGTASGASSRTDGRLAGGWLDDGARRAGRRRAADVATDPAAVLPRLERLRLVLHRLGGDEHRHDPRLGLLARDVAGSLAPAAQGGRGGRRCRRLALPVPSCSGPTRGVHCVLGLRGACEMLFWLLFYVI